MLTSSLSSVDSNMKEEPLHIPVMYREVMEYLKPSDGQTIIDGTVGLGQHSAFIADAIGAKGLVIGIDRDQSTLDIVESTLKEKSAQIHLVREDYRNIDQVLNDLNIDKVDGILLDLGISSFQLDNPDRGFSFQHDGPLDMRMNQSAYICAYDLINSLSEKEISMILKDFGEERWHRRIARFIIEERDKKPIDSTKTLSDLVTRAIPARFRRQKIHPATRTFQAMRIAVNRELESLEIALEKSISCLKEGGRICVISFHSLEDRIVKNIFRNSAREGDLEILTKKPLRPSEDEVEKNSRARSARFRAAIKKE